MSNQPYTVEACYEGLTLPGLDDPIRVEVRRYDNPGCDSDYREVPMTAIDVYLAERLRAQDAEADARADMEAEGWVWLDDPDLPPFKPYDDWSPDDA